MGDPQISGGHPLPPVFSGASPLARPPRRRRRGALVWSILTAVVLGAAAGTVQIVANVSYDEALITFTAARDDTAAEQEQLTTEIGELQAIGELAAAIVTTDSGTLMPAEARATLDTAIADAEAAAGQADAVADAELPDANDKPSWAWELFGETNWLADETTEFDDQIESIESEATAASAAAATVDAASVAALHAAAATATDFEAAHVNARNVEILDFRAAAAVVADGVTVLDSVAVTHYSTLETRAATMLASEQEELAEKSGRLRDARVAIEAFARALAPGVLLDFDWSATVRGYDGPSYGGWTQWWYGSPGYSTIALSNMVAEEWPADWTKALVAHEVGHAISVKCESKYDSSNQDTIEEWATAWALGMGYTHENNGVSAYGAPSQAMIDAARTCR